MLIKSASKKAVGENIATEERAGRPKKQAIAIALETQRRAAGKRRQLRGVREREEREE